MKVTILGSGTCVPSATRGPSGYLLEIDGNIILLDGGSGSLRQIAASGADYRQIGEVFYSHWHHDHTGELLSLLFARKNDPSEEEMASLRINGPQGIHEFVEGLALFAGDWIFDEEVGLTVRELDIGIPVELFSSICTPYKTMHTNESIGYRILTDDDEIFAYSGDAGEGEKLIELLERADLAIIECSFPDNQKQENHLTPSLVGKIAGKAGIKNLVLTHMYPSVEEVDVASIVSKSFDGHVIVAKDLDTYEV